MQTTIPFQDLTIKLTVDTDPPLSAAADDPVFAWQIETRQLGPHADLVGWRLRRHDGAAFRVTGCQVEVSVPAVDLHRVFVPVLHEAIGKRDLISLPWGVEERTFTSWSFPFLAALNRDDDNRFCMGFLDHVHTTVARHACYDEDARMALRRDFGAGLRTTQWEDGLYLSRARRPVFDEVRAFARVYDEVHDTRLRPAPAAAWAPVWCSWYGIKNDVDADYIRGMAPQLAAWGFGSIIVDAGWFRGDGFDEATGHYVADTAKFADLQRLVAEVQAQGLRILLWCAPLFRLEGIAGEPFISRHRFVPEDTQTPESVLCPRNRAVREYAARTVGHLMRSYGIDGLKIDFIDPLRERAALPCTADHEHDIVDYGEAVHATLAGIHQAATAVRGDALLEFRMNYSTLATRAFATSHRAQDAPFDFDHIRRMCTRLRSWIVNPEAGYEGNVAAHTDPAYWLPAESPQNVARFLASLVTSAVPMLSMDLRALPEVHRRLVRAWIAFYNEHRELLLFGAHRVLSADAHHSVFHVHRGDAALWGVFTSQVPGRLQAPAAGLRRLWLLNGSGQEHVCCQLPGLQEGPWTAQVYDRFLDEADRVEIETSRGAARLDLPVEVGGAVELTTGPT